MLMSYALKVLDGENTHTHRRKKKKEILDSEVIVIKIVFHLKVCMS